MARLRESLCLPELTVQLSPWLATSFRFEHTPFAFGIHQWSVLRSFTEHTFLDDTLPSLSHDLVVSVEGWLFCLCLDGLAVALWASPISLLPLSWGVFGMKPPLRSLPVYTIFVYKLGQEVHRGCLPRTMSELPSQVGEILLNPDFSSNSDDA
ncbi:hypothetical protein Acr_08g0011120 [Actinidia rufa]|uniref:Uncharacterized protein n=1 Tax=Actinidia rufa TaxID=165716 RepID=A0A7J0F2T6_9ERIC|nr:hypothetical protein Acr_08g0011120 [Actinidia rufa]